MAEGTTEEKPSLAYFCFLSLGIIGFLTWIAWEHDYHQPNERLKNTANNLARYNTSLEQLNIFNCDVSQNNFQASWNLSIKLENDHNVDIYYPEGVISIFSGQNNLLLVTSSDPVYLPVNGGKIQYLSINQSKVMNNHIASTFLNDRNLNNSMSFIVELKVAVYKMLFDSYFPMKKLVVTCGLVNMVFRDPTSLTGGPLNCITTYDGPCYDSCY